MRKVTAFVYSYSKRDDLKAREVIACLVKQVAIAINLLLTKKPIARLDLTIKKILKRLEAIKNKISACTKAVLPLKAGKFWV